MARSNFSNISALNMFLHPFSGEIDIDKYKHLEQKARTTIFVLYGRVALNGEVVDGAGRTDRSS